MMNQHCLLWHILGVKVIGRLQGDQGAKDPRPCQEKTVITQRRRLHNIRKYNDSVKQNYTVTSKKVRYTSH